MKPCRAFHPLLQTFLDGELPRDKVVEVEQHLALCDVCSERVRLDEAIRASTRRAVRSDATVTRAFEDRVRAAMEAERERRLPPIAMGAGWRGKALSWRAVVPIAAAAALVLLWGASTRRDAAPPATAPGAVRTTRGAAQPADALLDDIIENHIRTIAPEVTEPGLVKQFEPRVGVPVRMPALREYGARWEGGSVVPVRNYRAAQFRFRVQGHRVTVYVYDAKRVPLRMQLEARVHDNVPVFVGKRRGYSIAAVERAGVGHALTTDLGDDESADLVVASLR